MKRIKKGYGVVYTPKELSDYVSDLLIEEYKKGYKTNKDAPVKLTILDPACGKGALLASIEKKCKRTKQIGNVCYVGIDVESDVIDCNKAFYTYDDFIFVNRDTIIPQKNMCTSDFWTENGLLPDIIISNPPWSSEKIYNREDLENAGFKFDIGQYDSYVLFIELCIKILKEDGLAAFIIPDSIFAGENRTLRKFLLDNTEIKVISRLGEKLFQGVNRSTTILIVKKKIPSEKSKTNCFRLTTNQRKMYLTQKADLMEFHNLYSHEVQQNRFKENSNYLFDIDTKEEEEILLKKIEKNSIIWSDLFRFGRGVEISKTGDLVVCPYCSIAQGYSKKQLEEESKKCISCNQKFDINDTNRINIINNQATYGYRKIYVGENIHRYSLDGSKYIKMNVRGINYKREELYTPPKILIRKTGLGINACLDYDSTYISQTVYSCNLIGSTLVPLEYYLGILNSRIMYYYYLKKYGENEWKSHPYLTKEILFSLPLPSATETNINICTEIADKVRHINNNYDRKIDLEIEKLVAKLYGLTELEFNLVINEINNLPDLGAINNMKIEEEEICLDI